jgi:hypothetical protein
VVIVVVESPFAGDMEGNRKYAVKACADCFRRGETPFASHLLYPQILNELAPGAREQGITAGYEFWEIAHKIVFYVDHGWSSGMIRAKEKVEMQVFPFEERKIL